MYSRNHDAFLDQFMVQRFTAHELLAALAVRHLKERRDEYVLRAGMIAVGSQASKDIVVTTAVNFRYLYTTYNALDHGKSKEVTVHISNIFELNSH
ncbi:unnamed protein product [Rotaria magnacalcarata]|nr:unnamed protein product [Rotaria magnacalcarata]CAF2021007.1 unnamed protein product [Rotaria magnacalcarata]CAF3756051.1 unnamed protein product [Rotaria magnacalcarata]CAF3954936.1 unnamed protein product [Rotaria magnacalcarata]CAF4093643.1 unnamed protein product [Rotaria magnacalcarata]